jgi:hypothetical protein
MKRIFAMKARFSPRGVGEHIGAFALAATLVAAFAGDAAAQDKVMTIKLATATLNDAQHEWM